MKEEFETICERVYRIVTTETGRQFVALDFDRTEDWKRPKSTAGHAVTAMDVVAVARKRGALLDTGSILAFALATDSRGNFWF